MIRFIGDIHGKLGEYEMLLDADETVQIGDFGYGWFNDYRKSKIAGWHTQPLLGTHRFIRGNHDSPRECEEAPGWIKDGHFDKERSIMYVGGAWSIDWAGRTEGVSWWRDEELSGGELMRIHNEYVQNKPRIMVTHDAPDDAILELFEFPNFFGDFTSTRTSGALNAMFSVHQPDLWIFGHWHLHRDKRIRGTRFICLEELQSADVDPETLEIVYPYF